MKRIIKAHYVETYPVFKGLETIKRQKQTTITIELEKIKGDGGSLWLAHDHHGIELNFPAMGRTAQEAVGILCKAMSFMSENNYRMVQA